MSTPFNWLCTLAWHIGTTCALIQIRMCGIPVTDDASLIASYPHPATAAVLCIAIPLCGTVPRETEREDSYKGTFPHEVGPVSTSLLTATSPSVVTLCSANSTLRHAVTC
jgi:hypothetical protein